MKPGSFITRGFSRKPTDKRRFCEQEMILGYVPWSKESKLSANMYLRKSNDYHIKISAHLRLKTSMLTRAQKYSYHRLHHFEILLTSFYLTISNKTQLWLAEVGYIRILSNFDNSRFTTMRLPALRRMPKIWNQKLFRLICPQTIEFHSHFVKFQEFKD